METTNLLVRNLSMMFEKLKENEIDRNEIHQILQSTEQLLEKAAAEEGYNPKKKEEMFEKLKEHSIKRLTELEEKIKKKHSISFTKEQTLSLFQKIKEFWREEGFHYVSNIKTDQFGTIEVEFGFSLDFGSMFTDKKVTGAQKAKEKKQQLVDEGYMLDDKCKTLLDRDINKSKIKKLIVSRFPSAYIKSWRSKMTGKDDERLDRLVVRIKEPKNI